MTSRSHKKKTFYLKNHNIKAKFNLQTNKLFNKQQSNYSSNIVFKYVHLQFQ